MPNLAIELGEKFGRLMNYGDGMYAGQFIGAMYAEAFFEDDPVKIVDAGLKCIPIGSQYAEAVRDVLAWYRQYPDDWTRTWTEVDAKYHRNPTYRRFSSGNDKFNIDAKINGAYVVIGLLYGGRDPDRTIVTATRCGQDSDCNPSSAAGVLFTTIGMSKLPERFVAALDKEPKFSHTEYNFTRLLEVCEALARQAVVLSGGRIERGADGAEVLVIPIVAPKPSKLQPSWQPGPAAGSRYDEAERARITEPSAEQRLRQGLQEVAPGWTMADCGTDMNPGLRTEFRGRENVFVTHPLNRTTGCTLNKEVDVPEGKKTTLRLVVGHHPKGDWTLIVKADGQKLLEKPVGPKTADKGWVDVAVDLSDCAGKSVLLELVNQPDGWSNEAGYWAEIALESR
jgi:hypothetical protein